MGDWKKTFESNNLVEFQTKVLPYHRRKTLTISEYDNTGKFRIYESGWKPYRYKGFWKMTSKLASKKIYPNKNMAIADAKKKMGKVC